LRETGIHLPSALAAQNAVYLGKPRPGTRQSTTTTVATAWCTGSRSKACRCP